MTRHTWQSWRERYKKNAVRLDARIAEIVDLKKPALGEKGQYGYVRKPEEKPKRVRKKARPNSNGTVAAGPSEIHHPEMEGFPVPLPVAIPGMTGVLHAVGGPNDGYPGMGGMIYTPAPPPVYHPHHHQHVAVQSAAQFDAAAARQNAPEEEMEDDDSEWQIREGNAPPPPWAKRRIDDTDDQAAGPSKRQRTR